MIYVTVLLYSLGMKGVCVHCKQAAHLNVKNKRSKCSRVVLMITKFKENLELLNFHDQQSYCFILTVSLLLNTVKGGNAIS